MKKRNIGYIKPTLPMDFWAMVDIQTHIHSSVLNEVQRQKEGFIEYLLSSTALTASDKIGLTRIAVSRKSGYVIGFTAGVSYSIAGNIGYLQEILPSLYFHFKYACVAQLCVLPERRKQGVGTQLLRQMEYRAKRDKFEALIFPIHKENVVGAEFLLNRDFSVLPSFAENLSVFYKKC